MAAVALAIVSILALTGLAWLAGRVLRLPLCPVCMGVAGTWMWMLGARAMDFAIDADMLAILLGASVVGLAHQLEPHLAQGRSQLLWKVLSLPAGFVAAYGLVAERWGVAAIAGTVFVLMAAAFVVLRHSGKGDEETIRKIEDQMKKCC